MITYEKVETRDGSWYTEWKIKSLNLRYVNVRARHWAYSQDLPGYYFYIGNRFTVSWLKKGPIKQLDYKEREGQDE